MVRSMRGKWFLAMVVAAVVVGCGPGAAHYATVLDELAFPTAWELARTQVRDEGGEVNCSHVVSPGCPAVVRFYLVDARASDIYAEAKQVVTTAGYSINDEFYPACDAPPSGPACTFYALKDADQITVDVYNAGGGGDDGLGFARQDRSTVRVMAAEKY
jgi:hypothetical protein